MLAAADAKDQKPAEEPFWADELIRSVSSLFQMADDGRSSGTAVSPETTATAASSHDTTPDEPPRPPPPPRTTTSTEIHLPGDGQSPSETPPMPPPRRSYAPSPVPVQAMAKMEAATREAVLVASLAECEANALAWHEDTEEEWSAKLGEFVSRNAQLRVDVKQALRAAKEAEARAERLQAEAHQKEAELLREIVRLKTALEGQQPHQAPATPASPAPPAAATPRTSIGSSPLPLDVAHSWLAAGVAQAEAADQSPLFEALDAAVAQQPPPRQLQGAPPLVAAGAPRASSWPHSLRMTAEEGEEEPDDELLVLDARRFLDKPMAPEITVEEAVAASLGAGLDTPDVIPRNGSFQIQSPGRKSKSGSSPRAAAEAGVDRGGAAQKYPSVALGAPSEESTKASVEAKPAKSVGGGGLFRRLSRASRLTSSRKR